MEGSIRDPTARTNTAKAEELLDWKHLRPRRFDDDVFPRRWRERQFKTSWQSQMVRGLQIRSIKEKPREGREGLSRAGWEKHGNKRGAAGVHEGEVLKGEQSL